ncbi:hypothetical protein TWF730_000782 [Orbilia blumenaviensis]|uniref:Uncharacterized protein n=1 Tax=Orbilia blumenaviensis TaxID=1796055 RepID=A0AAV9VMM4_9PEZI
MAAIPSFSNILQIAHSSPNLLQLVQDGVRDIQLVAAGELDFFTFYKQTDPFAFTVLASSVLSVIVFIFSEITRNFSQVDRLWSILPAVYICHYSYWANINNLRTDRVDTVAVVSILWSIRLTYNYWRKGGYQWSSEDYRWDVIRKAIGAPAFFLMNLTFISFGQNFLLVAITAPVYLFLILTKNFPQTDATTTADTVFSRGMMMAVLLEFFADQQQWSFHQAKQKYKKTGTVPLGWDKNELDRGFVYSGLWAFSRHPNFVGEQIFWALLYQWSAFITDSVYNWTGVGALSYLLLFQGSTWLTELITSSKYKDYKVYQKHVSMFLPRVSAIKEGGFYFPEEEEEGAAATVAKEESKKDS